MIRALLYMFGLMLLWLASDELRRRRDYMDDGGCDTWLVRAYLVCAAYEFALAAFA